MARLGATSAMCENVRQILSGKERVDAGQLGVHQAVSACVARAATSDAKARAKVVASPPGTPSLGVDLYQAGGRVSRE